MSTSAEPTPLRDNGPYNSHAQARAQFAAVTHGLRLADDAQLSGLSALVLAEALLMAGVQTSEYETRQRDAIARLVDPETAQVIAGWIIRAHLAGWSEQTSSPAASAGDGADGHGCAG